MIDNDLHTTAGPVASDGDDPMVLALCPDMLFASRVRGAAQAVGVDVRLSRDREALLRALADAERPPLVLVDLAAAKDAVEAIAAVKVDRPDARVVAFARHDAAEAIAAARAAGADRVLARSAFVAQLPDILRGRR